MSWTQPDNTTGYGFDPTFAGFIQDPQSKTNAALGAAFVPRGPRNRVAFLGDSIAGFNGSGDNVATFENTLDNWTGFYPALTGGRIQYARSYSDAGFTTAQIAANGLQRLLAQTQGPKPGTCILLAGTNDVGLGASFVLGTTAAALTSIVSQLQAANINPVLCTVPPSNLSAAVRSAIATWNAYLVGFARSRGLPLIDLHAALTAVTDGSYSAGLNADSTHPSPAGMMAMAQAALASGYHTTLPMWNVGLVQDGGDTSNFINASTALFLSGLNGNGVPTGTSGFGGAGGTVSIVPGATNSPGRGNWAQISRPAGGTGGKYYLQFNAASSPFAATGDVVSFACRFKLSGATGGFASGGGATVNLQLGDAANTDKDAATFSSSQDLDGVVYLERVVRPDTAKLKATWSLDVPSTGTAILQIGQVTVRNLTALGIA